MVEGSLERITKLMRVVNEFYKKFQVLLNFWRVWVQKNILGTKQDENTLFGFILKIDKFIFSSQSNINFYFVQIVIHT